ncbi:MAG: type IV pilus secretin PilQ [Desulfobacterales bacterium]|nr:type IV pilus secretin PilQ [Desulfobacterales bacterium]
MNSKTFLSNFLWRFWLVLVTILLIGGCAKIKKAPDARQISKDAELSISDIVEIADSEKAVVSIIGTGELRYTSFKMVSPPGIIFYFPDTKTLKTGEINPKTDVIKGIKTSLEGNKTKIEIILSHNASYDVIREGNTLKVAIDKTSESKDVVVVEEKKSSEIKEIKPDMIKSAWVNRVDFTREQAGKSLITVGTTIPVKYDIRTAAGNKVQLRLFKTQIPGYRQKTLETGRFDSAINKIDPMKAPDNDDDSIIEFDMKELVSYRIEQMGNILLINFDSPGSSTNASLKAPSLADNFSKSDSNTEQKSMASSTELNTTNVELTPISKTSELDRYDAPKQKYTGQKIALDFYETDIKNVFRILKDVSGKNFAIDNNVSGKVSLTFDKPVPWDQIFELVLKMNQLGKSEDGDVIRIATLETLKAEEKLKIDSLDAMKKAQEQEKALEPLVTEFISVSYSDAKKEVLPHIEKILTKERGSVGVDERTSQIIMIDTVAKVKEAKRIIEEIDKVTPQVIIEARIVEANTNFSKGLGVTWEAAGGIQGDDARAGSGPERGFHNLGGTYGYNMALNYPIADNANLGINFTRIAGTPFLLNAKLMAMESEGEGRIVSSPKIMTLDNKEAEIKQGVEMILNYVDGGGDPKSLTKNIDLKLKVKPKVTPDDRIMMTLDVSKNDIGPSYGNFPTFLTKEAKTELLINNGDTIVIGGILKTKQDNNKAGLPYLSKIPFIGWLFKSQTKSNEKEELLIFLTPKIVKLKQKSLS